MGKTAKWALGCALLLTILGDTGCNLDKTQTPELAGPSELAVSIEMRAVPDQLTADGFSSSVIEAVWRDENGRRVAGRTVNFDLTARGVFVDIGVLGPLDAGRPVPGGREPRAESAVTDADGVARVRYWSPFRTDQATDIVVTITGRPAGTDFRAAVLRQVDIFIRASDRTEFAGDSVCSIIVEPQKRAYLVGEGIFFTAGQLVGDTGAGCQGIEIARYEWDFDDGSPPANARNTSHVYNFPGDYTVQLVTTEAVSGCVDSCTTVVSVTSAP